MPAKLAARVRVFSQGHGRKTDRDDAISIGLAALNAAGAQAVQPDGATVSLRLWCDRRDELVALAHPGHLPPAPFADRAHPREARAGS